MQESSKIIYKLYKEAVKIRKSCSEQRKVFSHWAHHHRDPVYESMTWDFETTGTTYGIPTYLNLGHTKILVHNPTVFGISMCIPYDDKFYLFWGRLGTSLFDDMVNLLGVKGEKNGHNIKYDIRTARSNKIYIAPTNNCTLTMARIAWDRLKEFSLQKLSEFICPQISDWEDDVKKEFRRLKAWHTRHGYPKGYVNYSFIDDKIMGKYSMTDSFMGQILNHRLRPIMMKDFPELYQREKKVYLNIIGSELRGIPFNRNKARGYITKIKRYNNKLIGKAKKIVDKDDFNPESPTQIRDTLLDMGVTRDELINKKKAVSADAFVLEKLSNETKMKSVKKLVDTVLEMRSNTKILKSYLIPLSRRAKHNNNIVYFTINPTNSRTGRMTGTDPCMQNLPRPKTGFGETNPVRACIHCRPGYKFFFFDYSQMEMAMFGLFAGDKRILKAYASGEDLHDYMTIQIFGNEAYLYENGKQVFKEDGRPKVVPEKRQKVKGVNFGVIYGMGIRGLADLLKIPFDEAVAFHAIYSNEFPSIQEAQVKAKFELEQHGYIEDMFGRRYHIEPSQAYKAVNAYIQGSCAQTTKTAYNKCEKYVVKLPPKIQMLIPIHDEFMYEYQRRFIEVEPEFVRGIQYRMEHIQVLEDRGFVFKTDVKHSVTNWEEKVKYELPVAA